MFFTSLSWRARACSVLAAIATVVGGVVAPAAADDRVTPGDFTGYGFDQCAAPSQAAMDAWLSSSPYWAVGIYIAGGNRACLEQPNLTATWVDTQLRNGWRLLPVTVGPQAACYTNPAKKIRIPTDPTSDYAAAREQARLEARETVRRARSLGIAAGSTLWYDIEHVNKSDIGTRCRLSTLSFLSTWTRTLHNLGYVSGVYGNASSWISVLDDARVSTTKYAMPDRIWVAEWMPATSYRIPPTATPPSLLSTYFRDDGWLPGGRMRQYRGDHDETHGGVTINIDTDYLDLGRGTRGGAQSFCGGVRVDFPTYNRLQHGDEGPAVKALQCLLRTKGLYDGPLSGFYSLKTRRAVIRFQAAHGMYRSGTMFRTTWTALLSEGSNPVVKVGSGGRVVRRVQRALNAAIHARLPVDGVFGPSTTSAVREYQGVLGVRRTGVVASGTWAALEAGRR